MDDKGKNYMLGSALNKRLLCLPMDESPNPKIALVNGVFYEIHEARRTMLLLDNRLIYLSAEPLNGRKERLR